MSEPSRFELRLFSCASIDEQVQLLTYLEPCPTCDGAGEVHSHNPVCWVCEGTGSVLKKQLEGREA